MRMRKADVPSKTVTTTFNCGNVLVQNYVDEHPNFRLGAGHFSIPCNKDESEAITSRMLEGAGMPELWEAVRDQNEKN